MGAKAAPETGAILSIPGPAGGSPGSNAMTGAAGGGGESGRMPQLDPQDRILSPWALLSGMSGFKAPKVSVPPVTAVRPRGGPGGGESCRTCNPKDEDDPEIWMYRGIQLPRLQKVDGPRPGQMASADPRDALHYGINPPGARPPSGADTIVLMRFKVRRSQMNDPAVSSGPAPAGTAPHFVVNDGIDITRLPGYTEQRLPISSVAGARDPDRHIRIPKDDAVDAAVQQLRAPTIGHNGAPGPPLPVER